MTHQMDGKWRTGVSATDGSGAVDEHARDTYRVLRDQGMSEADIMAFAGELLSLVASDVRASAAAE